MVKKNKSCIRCGKCCDSNALAFIKKSDIQRWEVENRTDIFEIIENSHSVWAGDRMISIKDGHSFYTCPFLEVNGRNCVCSIYETRPHVCVNFKPGSSALCPLWDAETNNKK